jgi:hypothetical protein
VAHGGEGGMLDDVMNKEVCALEEPDWNLFEMRGLPSDGG